jgi:hypothetical protein
MAKMMVNLRKLGILLALTLVLLLGTTLLALSYVDIGLTDIVGEGEVSRVVPDLSTVPESVVEDATELAQELFGDYQDKYNEFISQLLATYVEARDKDFVVIFNSGGWGWNLPENSPGWQSILSGIKSELEELGYRPLLLNYRRTTQSLRSVIDELVEVVRAYPSKAKNLARQVDFLTAHLPGLKVIVAGESNGTIFSDSVMRMLRDNPRVYSIQTGTPFWHRNMVRERTLVVNNNGIVPDSFSQGDIPKMLWASLKALFGLSSSDDEDPGRILRYMRAPGHDYRWHYPGVYSQITEFLKKNFGSGRERY